MSGQQSLKPSTKHAQKALGFLGRACAGPIGPGGRAAEVLPGRIGDGHQVGAGGLVQAVTRAHAAAEAAGRIAPEPPPPPPDPWPAAWESSAAVPGAARAFWQRCDALGLALYRDQLAALTTGALTPNELYRRFQTAWRAAAPGPGQWRGALLMGGEGTGKSICALWACLEAAQAGGTWDFVDVAELAEFWARQKWTRFDELRAFDLVVFDELADIQDLRGHVWAQFKAVLNARYRAGRDTIVNAVDDEATLRSRILGPEIVDRFPPELRRDAGGRKESASWRHGQGGARR